VTMNSGDWSVPGPVLPWLWQAMVDAGNVGSPRLGPRGELVVTAYETEGSDGLAGDFVVSAEPVAPRDAAPAELTRQEQRPSQGFNPEDWDGDPDDLRGYERDLVADEDLCSATFATKREAFSVGLVLGENATDNR
jgi:hypothetical protein